MKKQFKEIKESNKKNMELASMIPDLPDEIDIDENGQIIAVNKKMSLDIVSDLPDEIDIDDRCCRY